MDSLLRRGVVVKYPPMQHAILLIQALLRPLSFARDEWKGWEGMPYPQSDTIQELQFAMSRNLLTREDLAAVQDAIQARQ